MPVSMNLPDNDLDALLDDAFDELLLTSKGTESQDKEETTSMTTGKERKTMDDDSTLQATFQSALADLGSESKRQVKSPLAHPSSQSQRSNESSSLFDLGELMNQFPELNDLLPEDMSKLSGSMGGGIEDEDEFIESFVNQLLSKDFLFEPLKELSMAYPGYLEKHENRIPEEQYLLYKKQSEYLEELIIYWESTDSGVVLDVERTEDDVTAGKNRAWDLLQKVESCGQPPEELLPAGGGGGTEDINWNHLMSTFRGNNTKSNAENGEKCCIM